MTHVTGAALRPDGTAYAYAVFSLVRSPALVVAQSGGVVTPFDLTVTADAAGLVDFTILSGNYTATETTTGRRFSFVVPDQATANFGDCVDAATAVILPDMIVQALAAEAGAEAAATRAEAAASGGGGGSSAWGGITGTLSDQADLQSALTGKVSTTGAETIAGKKTFSSEWGATALGADPASPVNGDEWLSPDGALKGRQEGATFRLSSPWVATLIRPSSGEWLTNTQHGSGGAHGQGSGILNALDLAPWRPSFDFVSSNVVFTINGAGGAGVLCKSIIYEGDPLTGKPLTKIFEGADKDANTIGTKSEAFSYSFRSDRTYWIGVRHSASTTVVANWSASAGADIFVAGYTSGARKSLRRTLTYATAAPSTWTWSASELTTLSPWAFWIQAA